VTAVAPDSIRPLLGHVLARVVFVEGTGGGTKLTDAERHEILKHVETAAKHLTDLHDRWRAAQQPPVLRSCRFTITSERVTIDLDPATLPPPSNAEKPKAADFEAIDGKWIDAALETLGHSKSQTPRREDRIRDLVADAMLEQLFGGVIPGDAYVIFLTKYPCHWMGYAKPEIGFCTLCPPMLDKGGWKGRYDLVAAHETGHVFGAPDEYVDKNVICNPNEVSGPFGIPNANCERNNPGSVKCLMRRGDLALCHQTPLHWGWQDADHDGTLDLLAPPTIDRLTVFDPIDAVWIPDCHAGAPGWSVNIKGRNLWDARVVTFGGIPSPRIWRLALDEISVAVPEDAFGIVTIAVATRAGPSQATFEQSWFLVAQPVQVPAGPPVVFGLVPSSGPAGTAVTILGADLLQPTSIRFGRVFADLSALDPLEDREPTRVTIAAPPGPAGPVPVVVTSDRGSSQPWLFSTFVYK